MGNPKFVVSLVREVDEDAILKELWSSIVQLRNSYLYHSHRRKVKNSKKKGVNKKVISPALGNKSIVSVPRPPVPTNGASKVPLVPLPPVVPTTSKVVFLAPTPVQGLPKAPSIADNILLPTKSWVDIVSPPKLVRPDSGPIAPPVEPVDNGDSSEPPKLDKKSAIRSKSEKGKKKASKRKASSSSSSSSVSDDEPPPKSSKSKPGKGPSRADLVKRRKKLEAVGADLSAIRFGETKYAGWWDKQPVCGQKRNLYVVWKAAKVGVFGDWGTANAFISGFSGALYKKVLMSEYEAFLYFEKMYGGTD